MWKIVGIRNWFALAPREPITQFFTALSALIVGGYAFQWLERAYAQRDLSLNLIKGDPLLHKLEADPRYKAFLRKMNLPE